MVRTLGDVVDLAGAIGIDEIGRHQIRGRDALRVGDGERRRLYRGTDRAPHVDDGKAMLEEGLGVVRLEEIAHPLSPSGYRCQYL